MAIPFDRGYYKQPFVKLVSEYPAEDVYPPADFRVEWGPVFHRGRLDGSAHVLIIGQDPAQHEVVARRILVGTAGKRAQGFLQRLGITRSYVFINTFLYSVYGQGGGTRHIGDPAITAYRNRWIKAILDRSTIEAVVALGGLANTAWQSWLASPDAAGRSPLPFRHLTHPTWPESSASTNAERQVAVTKMLQNWNDGLAALRPAIQHFDVAEPLALYGTTFVPGDLPDILADDLPPGTPAWMRTEEGWADRKGETPLEKRRTIVVRVPKDVLPA
ncbi:uracil-DNA glycosylase family protein [Nitrosospira sp. NpAV]|uniref:uracil-DNA glycosylase family protein n=1 Tax=Nitrosospira sp. NpAV TaxID=58133 RepID=UPI00059F2C90|nr:uracil-DNA glycosylase family protein [Nitrosospira sp. NpAV]KIO48462.1 uracil-DNA glycosylase [Nitrosospira sp. NpAV]